MYTTDIEYSVLIKYRLYSFDVFSGTGLFVFHSLFKAMFICNFIHFSGAGPFYNFIYISATGPFQNFIYFSGTGTFHNFIYFSGTGTFHNFIHFSGTCPLSRLSGTVSFRDFIHLSCTDLFAISFTFQEQVYLRIHSLVRDKFMCHFIHLSGIGLFHNFIHTFQGQVALHENP